MLQERLAFSRLKLRLPAPAYLPLLTTIRVIRHPSHHPSISPSMAPGPMPTEHPPTHTQEKSFSPQSRVAFLRKVACYFCLPSWFRCERLHSPIRDRVVPPKQSCARGACRWPRSIIQHGWFRRERKGLDCTNEALGRLAVLPRRTATRIAKRSARAALKHQNETEGGCAAPQAAWRGDWRSRSDFIRVHPSLRPSKSI
jgi:hypothetical protein